MSSRIRKSIRIGFYRRLRRRLRLPMAIACALSLQALVYSRFSNRPVVAPIPGAAVSSSHEFEPLIRAAVSPRLSRPVYRLSVIRGGAYSAEELRQALDSDEVAARHYDVFERASLRIEPSPFKQPVYVSYRMGNSIYWTKHTVSLPPGETLLTDGTNYARARCGNRVALQPQAPVEAQGPAPEVLEHVETPAPETTTLEWREALLAPEVFPSFFPETPAQTAVMMPAIIGENQQGFGYGFLPGAGSLIPFQLQSRESTTPVTPTPPTPPIQPSPIPDLPPDIPPAPPACCSIATPPVTPPSTPPETPPTTPPTTPPSTPPETPPYFPPFAPPYTPPELPPYTPPTTPPVTPPNTPPETPPYTPPVTPPNTPPTTPPIPPETPPITPVPEPGSLVLLLSALGAGVVARRQLKSKGNRRPDR